MVPLSLHAGLHAVNRTGSVAMGPLAILISFACRRTARIGGAISAFGTKRTWHLPLSISAFGGKADIGLRCRNVCF
jgi:hypothetical protein